MLRALLAAAAAVAAVAVPPSSAQAVENCRTVSPRPPTHYASYCVAVYTNGYHLTFSPRVDVDCYVGQDRAPLCALLGTDVTVGRTGTDAGVVWVAGIPIPIPR